MGNQCHVKYARPSPICISSQLAHFVSRTRLSVSLRHSKALSHLLFSSPSIIHPPAFVSCSSGCFFIFLFLFFSCFYSHTCFLPSFQNSSAEAHPATHPHRHNFPFFPPRAPGRNRRKRKNKKCALGARPRVPPRRRRRRPHHRRQPRRYHRQRQPGPRRW